MKIFRTSLLFSLFLSLPMLFLGPTAIADEQAVDDPSGWQVAIGIGAGVRTNPVMDNNDIPLILVPQINYQGENFFIQNLDFGYTLYENRTQQINAFVTPSYDQVFFNSWDANNFVADTQSSMVSKTDIATVEKVDHNIDKRKLHERRMAALAGFEYSLAYQGLDFQLQALHEITGYYSGEEVRLALTKDIVAGKHDVKLTLGANWQSAKTLDYFYGVNAQEAPEQYAYSPSSGVTTLLRFDWNYQIDEHWSLRLLTSYKHLSEPILNSPLTTNNNVITAFAGGVYHF